MTRVAPPVRPGAHIRVVSPTAPSVAYLPDRTRRAEQALTSAGFTVSYGAVDTGGDGTTAGSPRARAEDLMAAFRDPTVDVVLAADAGDRTEELIDCLDPAPFVENPKPFIGFCDNVYLNLYLYGRAGLCSLYGATFIPHLGEAGGDPQSVAGLVRALDSSTALSCEPVGPRSAERINWYIPEEDARVRRRCVPGGWVWLRHGTATGRLLGSEISILPELAGSGALPLTDTVLFWHNSSERDPEGQFRTLCQTVDLSGLAGMIVGAHRFTPPWQWAARVADMLDELLPDADYPVLAGADISHLSPIWTVPYGERVRLDSAMETVHFPRAEHHVVER